MWLLSTLRSVWTFKNRSTWDRQQVLAYQKQRFGKLMRHLWANSPFYHGYYSDHGIREADLDEIGVRDLPIINKEILMDHFDLISNDEALRRGPIETWIHSGVSGIYRNRFVVIHTSGTSGTLGIFVYDKAAWTCMRGVTTRVGTARINPVNRVRLAWYGATHGRFAGVTSCSTLPSLFCNTRLCSVLDPLTTTIDTLNRFQPEQLFGYAAAVHQLADAALAGDLRISPKFVTTSGEVQTDEAAAAIERAWGVAPSNAYGTSESLCLGIRGPGSRHVELMEDENLIEILGDDDAEVRAGEVGRAVITALYNYAIPIVRYDLKDYVKRGQRAENEAFDHIIRVEGRVNDALPITLNGGSTDTIHPVVLSEFFVPGVRKFQFISESASRVKIKYLAGQDLDSTVQEEFGRILAMKGAGVSTASTAQKVDDLPADPSTGKHRLVVLSEPPIMNNH